MLKNSRWFRVHNNYLDWLDKNQVLVPSKKCPEIEVLDKLLDVHSNPDLAWPSCVGSPPHTSRWGRWFSGCQFGWILAEATFLSLAVLMKIVTTKTQNLSLTWTLDSSPVTML